MKILSYIISPIFALIFFIILLIFHPIQWLAFNIFGYQAHKKTVDYLNWFLMKSVLILGIRVKVKMPDDLPKNTSLIFVSNHQSMFDIPPLVWAFRKFHPKFVSKIELAKGIPSVSYNLRHGGAAIIDRKDPKQALRILLNFAKNINKNKWSAVIFPEGTRSRTGVPKSFSPNGLKMMSKYNPEGYIIPISINNSWKVFKYGKFPLGLGAPIMITVHNPISIKNNSFDDLFSQVENAVKLGINEYL